METRPEGSRVPPHPRRTAVAADDPGGVVLVDVERLEESEGIAAWLRLKGQCPVLALWSGLPIDPLDYVEMLGFPVVGVVTEHMEALEGIAERFPGALRIALADPGAEAPGADFVILRPFRRDLVPC